MIVDPFTAAPCIGKRSIQAEINMIIKTDHPSDWAIKIRDKSVREAIRSQLRQDLNGETLYCDYRAGECVCYDPHVSRPVSQTKQLETPLEAAPLDTSFFERGDA